MQIQNLGHIIDSEGTSPDPKRTDAIRKMPPPASLTELRRFMGIVNQLNKFSPKIAELSQPLRKLLSPKQPYTHGHQARMMPFKSSRKKSPQIEYWPCTTLPKSVLMHQPTV